VTSLTLTPRATLHVGETDMIMLQVDTLHSCSKHQYTVTFLILSLADISAYKLVDRVLLNCAFVKETWHRVHVKS